MVLAVIGAVAIAVIALVMMAFRRARSKPPPAIADSYDELDREPGAQIVARRLGEGAEDGAEPDGPDATTDRLLEPPEWPEDFSVRPTKRSGVL